jgi:6-pyruvoyltetrahydropterin/6-carboxytetrahydropterin synthase
MIRRTLAGEQGTMRYLVYRETSFAAAHRLRNYRGKCENLHGHNCGPRYRFSRRADQGRFVMDFTDLDTLAAQVLEHLIS